MPRQGKAPNRRSQAHLVLLCTGGVPLPTGASLRSLVRGNTHAGFWSRGGQSDLSIDCNQNLVPCSVHSGESNLYEVKKVLK